MYNTVTNHSESVTIVKSFFFADCVGTSSTGIISRAEMCTASNLEKIGQKYKHKWDIKEG